MTLQCLHLPFKYDISIFNRPFNLKSRKQRFNLSKNRMTNFEYENVNLTSTSLPETEIQDAIGQLVCAGKDFECS